MRHCVPEKINQHIHAAQNKDPGFTNSLWICQGRPINMKIITISIRKPSVSAKSEERSADIFLKTASMSTFFQKTTGEFERAADAASRLSDEIIKLGGCPCAENGIGKIKRPL